jgi:signal transduction histidine kinase
VPSVTEAGHQELRLESTLAELRRYHFQIAPHHTGREVLQLLEQYPALPGVILYENQQFLGMLSRTQLLEFLLRPQGQEVFIPQPISVLHSYAHTNSLLLTETTSILAAAQLALRRSFQQQNEPIVVISMDQETSSPIYQLLDIRELNIAYWQIRGIETQVRYERTQVQMIQTEKMASLGRLVDGVAHEILDPVGFIWGNLVHLSTYLEQVMQLVKAYETQFPALPQEIAHLRNDIEFDYLCQDIPQTINSIRTGADRLKKLAASLQNFCHVDEVYPKPSDLHECLDSIVLLLKSRLTGEIEIIKDYGYLPPVSCYAGQLNQVFMNILSNAVDTLLNQVVRQEVMEKFGGTQSRETRLNKPQITIKTQVCSSPIKPTPVKSTPANTALRWVSICIADNGPGLSPEKRQQIIDSFSVEKRADKETSLAVSYQIVTARHGGEFQVRSPASILTTSADESVATGTEFEILLPLM